MSQSSIIKNRLRRHLTYLFAGLALITLLIGVGSVNAQSTDAMPQWADGAGSLSGNCYTVSTPGSDIWSALFGAGGFSFDANTTYTVQIVATGSGDMNVNVGSENASLGYPSYGSSGATTLSGSPTTIEFTFQPGDQLNNPSNITYQVGGPDGSQQTCITSASITAGGSTGGNTGGNTGGGTTPVTNPGAGDCTVSVRYDNAWDGGVVANVAIFNNTGSSIDNWDISFDWADASGATIGDFWVAGDVQASGSGITASANASDAGTANIEHNDVRTFGFVAEGGSLAPTSAKPTNFTVGGVNCTPPNPQGFPGQNTGGTLPILNDDADYWSRDTLSAEAANNECIRRFELLYTDMHDPSNNYFDEEGIPYHTVEELNVEAPDYGHVTTSEAFSYMLLLEAAYGKVTGDWSPFEKAFAILEHVIIPDAHQQPTWANHTTNMEAGESVASYAPEFSEPAGGLDPVTTPGGSSYPSTIDLNVTEGVDPIYSELQAYWNGGATNSGPIYTMHWLLDVDNTYQFGAGERGNANSVFINTFQRGGQESTWETLPHPSYEEDPGDVLNQFAGVSENGTIQDGAPQWRYTNAPDADARAMEAIRYAQLWAEPSAAGQIAPITTKVAKMADYLRYDMFDKYFMPIGCDTATDISSCTSGSGDGTYPGAHDLYAWYSSWGSPIDQDWSFLIGSSDVHMGYQGPWGAYAVKEGHFDGDANNMGISPEGKIQYTNSFKRQMDFYLWLQADEPGTQPNGDALPGGFFAGGATNSVNGRYENSLYTGPKFFGMAYDANPVYHDPGSNTWFGFQVWSGQRYMYTVLEMADAGDTGGDYAAYKDAADDWAEAAIAATLFDYEGMAFAVPSGLDWLDDVNNMVANTTNVPGVSWNGGASSGLQDINTNLQVNITSYSQDVGVGGSLARTLLTYSAIPGATFAQEAGETAMQLMDAMWNYGYTVDDYGTRGMAISEYRGDYLRWWNPTHVNEAGYTMGNGVTLTSESTFDEIHWFYADMCEGVTTIDPNNPDHHGCIQYCEVMDSWSDINGDGSPSQRAPKMVYHRFWGNVDNIMALIEADEFGYTCGDIPTYVTTQSDGSIPEAAADLINSSGPSSYPPVCEDYVQIGDPVPIEPVSSLSAPTLSLGNQTVNVGDAVNVTPTSTGSGLAFSASGLPAGLSINPATGEISGVPTTAGTATSTITVTDGNSAPVSITVIWTVVETAIPTAVVTNGVNVAGSAYIAVAALVAVMGAMTVGFVVRND